MITRYNVTENRDGMGFSNGLSLDHNGDYVSYSDYEKLKRAYDALSEDMTAAQGQIADAQAALDRMKKLEAENAQLKHALVVWDAAHRTGCNEPLVVAFETGKLVLELKH